MRSVGKDSASERKEPSLLELFAERSLSYSKIVQVRAKQKKTPQDFHLLGRTQPILFKDSASERKAKENSAGFSFAWPSAAYLI